MLERLNDKLKVTAIVAVRNEEKNIGPCLESVATLDQIFVVDSHSCDRTCQIADEMGATVVQFQYDGSWPKKRNWALRELPIRNEWVLLLDADERISPPLLQEIKSAIERETVNGFYVRWKFYFLGKWMKHCWRHGWMLRLFRLGKAEYEDLGLRNEGGWDAEVHENVLLMDGKAAKLTSWLIHDSHEDLSFWIKKQNEFSTWNAKRRFKQRGERMPSLLQAISRDPVRRRKWFKSLFVRIPCKSLAMFFWLYFFKFGFLDGREGYLFCRLRAIHEFNIGAKLFELQRRLNS